MTTSSTSPSTTPAATPSRSPNSGQPATTNTGSGATLFGSLPAEPGNDQKLGPDGKPVTDPQKVAAMKTEGVKPLTVVGLVLPILLAVLAVALWFVSPIAALVTGLVALAMLGLWLLARHRRNQRRSPGNQRTNGNGHDGRSARGGAGRPGLLNRLRSRGSNRGSGGGGGGQFDSGGGGRGSAGGAGSSGRHRGSRQWFGRNRRGSRSSSSQGDNGGSDGTHDSNSRSRNPFRRWRRSRNANGSTQHGRANQGDGNNTQPGASQRGSRNPFRRGRNSAGHAASPGANSTNRRVGGFNNGGNGAGGRSRFGRNRSAGNGPKGSNSSTGNNGGGASNQSRRWNKPSTWRNGKVNTGNGTGAGSSGNTGRRWNKPGTWRNGARSATNGSNAGRNNTSRSRGRNRWFTPWHDSSVNTVDTDSGHRRWFDGRRRGHRADGTYRYRHGPRRWRQRWSGPYAGFNHWPSSSSASQPTSEPHLEPVRVWAERTDRPTHNAHPVAATSPTNRGMDMSRQGVNNGNAGNGANSNRGNGVAVTSSGGGGLSRGSGSVAGAAIGRPEAQTHLGSMGGTNASAVEHISLATRCRRIAMAYATSGDRHLMGVAAMWSQRAAHADEVAQNRAQLTAGHSAAASEAANRQ